MSGCTDRGCPEPRGSDCHCAGCHQTFGGLGLFDAHQVTSYGADPPVTCRPPGDIRVTAAGRASPRGTLPLVPDGRGVWTTPAGLAQRQRGADWGARRRKGGAA